MQSNIIDSNATIIYIDGSAQPNPGPGGAAAVIYDNNMKKIKELVQYFPNTTNNRTELSALLLVLNHLNSQEIANIKYIYSDSQYLVSGYNIWSKSWKLKNGIYIKQNKQIISNSDLWIQILAYKSLNICWVKAHSDNIYNNYADQLAKNIIKQYIN